MLTNGGIVIDSLPSGPSTVTVGLCCAGERRPPFFGGVGWITEKLTEGGIDRGALPICDWLEVVAEKALAGAAWKAGTRKAGMETDGEEAIALRADPRLVESIAAAVL